VGAVLGLGGAYGASDQFNLADFASLALIGSAMVSIRRPLLAIRRLAVDIAVVVVLFIGCSYVFTIIKALLFTVGEIEDAALIEFEVAILGVALHRPVAAWSSNFPWFVTALDDIYFRLFDHMAVTSLFLVGAGLHRERTRLWSSLALCYLLGGPMYYLIPALGPRFVEAERFAFMEQLPLVSNYMQSVLFHNTHAVVQSRSSVVSTYSYLACMPSLHMAHEFVLLYYARKSKLFFSLSLVFSVLTSIAILVLGWHYAVDILGGLLLAFIAVGVVHISRDRLLPRIVFQRGCYLLRPWDRGQKHSTKI
jgi:hypothetical protein